MGRSAANRFSGGFPRCGILYTRRARRYTAEGDPLPHPIERIPSAMMRSSVSAGLLLGVLLCAGSAFAQDTHAKPVVLERRDATVTLEAYAPNIVRVTMSLKK